MLKKILCIFMTFLMFCGAALPVFADETEAATHTITINGQNAGHTYVAFQIFAGDLDSTGKVLSNVTWGDGVDGDLLLVALNKLDAYADCKNAADVAKVLAGFEEDSEEMDAFAMVAANWLTNIAGTSTENQSPYTITVTGDGFYFIADSPEYVATEEDAYTKFMLQVVGDVTVEAKADAPYLEKKILTWGSKSDSYDAAVGDDVSYGLTSVVPDMDGYDKYFFVIHDTMAEGLTFQPDSLKVWVDGNQLDQSAYSLITEGLEDGCTFELVLKNFIQYKNQAGSFVTVGYDATVNEKAAVGTTGTSNKAHLVYSNNPNMEQTGAEDNEDMPGPNDLTGETPDDITLIYTTNIKVIKVDDSKEQNPLPGAEFSFEIPTPMSDTGDDSIGTPITDSDDNGVHLYSGLSAGYYTITETKAPDGYNLLEEPIFVYVICECPTEVETGEEQAVWKYTLNGAIEQETTVAEDGVIEITVVNHAGTTLPSTGGMGTTLFYIFGILFILGSSIVLVSRKCMDER